MVTAIGYQDCHDKAVDTDDSSHDDGDDVFDD